MSFKNKIFSTLILALLIFAMTMPAMAVDAIFCKSMTGTTAAGTATSLGTYAAYVAIPGDNNGQVVVTSLSGTADTAGQNIVVYDKESTASINAAADASATTVSIVSGGGNFDVGDFVLFQDASGSTLFLETVTATAATVLTISAIDSAVTATGWTIYEMESIATIPVGNATASYQSDVAVAAGTKNSPLLLTIPGSAACSINFASGHYR